LFIVQIAILSIIADSKIKEWYNCLWTTMQRIHEKKEKPAQ